MSNVRDNVSITIMDNDTNVISFDMKQLILESLNRFWNDAETEELKMFWDNLYTKVNKDLSLTKGEIEDINNCMKCCTIMSEFRYDTYVA